MKTLIGTSMSGFGAYHVPDNSRFMNHRFMRFDSNKRAVFLDRDGVLIEDVGFLATPGEIRVLQDVTSAIRLLQNFFYIVVITNQSGIARGYFDENDLLQIHLSLTSKLFGECAIVDALYYCPHLPDGLIKEYSVFCDCRKPKPGLLLRAQQDWNLDMVGSFMVGDMDRDVSAGVNAGTSGILLNDTGDSNRTGSMVAPNLLTAAKLIMETVK